MDLTALIGDYRRRLAEGDGRGAWHAIQDGLRSHLPSLADLKMVADLLGEGATFPQGDGPPRLRVAMLGGPTTSVLEMAVRGAAAAEGWLADIYHGPFNAAAMETRNPASGLYAFRPDVALLALDWQDAEPYRPDPTAGDDAVDRGIESYCRTVEDMWQAIKTHGNFPVIQHTLAHPGVLHLGPQERSLPASRDRWLDLVNARAVKSQPGFVHWLDCDQLADLVGRANWFSPRHYHRSKLGFDPRHLPRYMKAFAAALRSVFARSKKCLVLDLDGTLWGGTIGDDGVGGIEFGAGSAEGEAYHDFAQYLKALSQRGVILAVCSKNEPALARGPFESLAGMPLRLADFSAFDCSWDPKATGLRRIAATLNLPLDSLVLLDDNPFECAQVRQAHPDVTVLEVPPDPAKRIAFLDSFHLFDAQSATGEDLLRSRSYNALALAEAARGDQASLDDFLRSLEMTADIGPPKDVDLDRIAQLEARTNQFNMTTRRYSRDRLHALRDREGVEWLSLRLEDRLANHGLVASLIGVVEGEDLRIDSWVVSCRVFSRTVEEFMLNALAERAKARGLRHLIGEYRPTERNRVISDLYARLGFQPDVRDTGLWSYDLARANQWPTHIQSRRTPDRDRA